MQFRKLLEMTQFVYTYVQSHLYRIYPKVKIQGEIDREAASYLTLDTLKFIL